MILTLDLGNTNLFIGVFDENKLVATYRTHSDITKSSDNYRDIISMFLFQKGFKITDFKNPQLFCYSLGCTCMALQMRVKAESFVTFPLCCKETVVPE